MTGREKYDEIKRRIAYLDFGVGKLDRHLDIALRVILDLPESDAPPLTVGDFVLADGVRVERVTFTNGKSVWTENVHGETQGYPAVDLVRIDRFSERS